ncbi:GyrI-like domain-containing protein [Rhodococcus sp. IEGM 1318]|uniref:GyrI-like domain-containing protein n=1 Tax=Rhodococcus sp. IEGM 1318 TaxID=3082226 RepID=UPI002955B370|nr:GyrI-like domain-containing protein [Rhodococcus sp. IEGM 1318]MDV8008687.1 GyrI-like domain-containing protein [Rhodococcus sp. IEGM 1318]
MTTIRIVENSVQPTAGIREQVPLSELSEFFSRAFAGTLAALHARGVHPSGPPFGKYFGRPTDVVDVEAGFPVSVAITPVGNVVPGALPGGKAVEAVHVGPYDAMARTYAELERYCADARLIPSAVMWESYLSDPEAEPDPEKWRTRICWPIDES